MTMQPKITSVTNLIAINDEESLRRKLEDLEDAYGEAIRNAKRDFDCTDINVNDDGMIWATVGGVSAPTGVILPEHAAKRIVMIVSDIDGQPITKASLNANLPTGERFAAFLPPLVSRITISIRLPPRRIYTLEEYVAAGRMTQAQAKILSDAVRDRKNILVVGSTGAGKTTLANALLAEAAFTSSRTCIVQDQRELQLSGTNVVSVVTGVMTTREVIREFLRHNPDRIIVGEIRDGHAAEEWIGACNTGHPGGLSTIHANSAQLGLRRIASLIGKVTVNVDHYEIAEAVDVVVFITKEGGHRRVVEIVRPTGYDGKKYLTETLA
jgi:type IV secretion system protein VirB11